MGNNCTPALWTVTVPVIVQAVQDTVDLCQQQNSERFLLPHWRKAASFNVDQGYSIVLWCTKEACSSHVLLQCRLEPPILRKKPNDPWYHRVKSFSLYMGTTSGLVEQWRLVLRTPPLSFRFMVWKISRRNYIPNKSDGRFILLLLKPLLKSPQPNKLVTRF